MRDVMVDLETTGTSPERTAIIQIAAARFDLETGDVDANFFNACLSIPPWRFWDEDTRAWWGQQKASTLQSIYARMRSPAQVMDEFIEWVGYGTGARMWAKPLTFEWPFIASYCKDFGHLMPFSFREAMDCRSYLSGLAHPEPFISEKSIEFDGTVHDAIFDVLHQVKWVLANQRKFGHVGREASVQAHPGEDEVGRGADHLSAG